MRLLRWLWPDPVLLLERGTKVAVIARSGGGKTTWLRWLLRLTDSAVVYDSKQHGDWSGDPDYAVVSEPQAAFHLPKVVVLIEPAWLRDKAGWKQEGTPGWNWTLALAAPMARAETITVFDEGKDTLALHGHDDAYGLYRKGRDIGVLVLAASQGARNIGTHVLEDAPHAFVAHVSAQRDRDAIASTRSVDTAVLALLRHPDEAGRGPREFAYHRLGWLAWRVFRTIDPDRPGRLEERAYVPDPELAGASAPKRAGAWVGAWWRRTRPHLGLCAVAGVLDLLGYTRYAAVPLALALYLAARAWRARQWRVVVEVGQPNLGPAPVAEGTLPFRRPSRSAAARRLAVR